MKLTFWEFILWELTFWELLFWKVSFWEGPLKCFIVASNIGQQQQSLPRWLAKYY